MSRYLLYSLLFWSALPLLGNPLEMARLSRWEALRQHFQQRKPGSARDHHLLARSFKELGQKNESIKSYLLAAGIECAPTDRSCLGRYNKKVSAPLAVLGILRAAEQLPAAEQSALLATLKLKDQSATSVDAALALMNQPDRELAQATALGVNIKDHRVLTRKGDLLVVRQKDVALVAYLEAANQGPPSVRKTIKERLERHMSGMLAPEELQRPIRRNRMLLALYTELDEHGQAALRKAIRVPTLLQTSSPETLNTDGIFLIRSGQAHALPTLAEKARSHLEKDPAILTAWLSEAQARKEDSAINGLLTRFEKSLPQSAELWRFKLNWIKSTRGNTAYFAEKTRFLNYFGWNFEWSDELVNELIGDTQSIRWAPAEVWKAVAENMQPATSNGRLVYWLHRYYLHTNQKAAADRLMDSFWHYAPGSYYARSFWDKQKGGHFARDWQKVTGREAYLRWISHHGGNTAALAHIRNRNLNHYRDPTALNLQRRLATERQTLPRDLLDLYQIGELVLADRSYNQIYLGKILPTEHHLNKAKIGKLTNRLNMSVYFTRQYLRQHRIPEDPFSLPRELLRTLYPEPYRPLVDRYAREYGIQPEMVYAIMHQESLFRENAISRSGARGLMQVMPATGKWIADKLKIQNYDLLEPAMSIQLGTKFFADLLKQYDNDFRWSAIAYNGGPGNLRKWKRNHYEDDFNLFLERIPIAEPRNYCRITYQNYMHYRVAAFLMRN